MIRIIRKFPKNQKNYYSSVSKLITCMDLLNNILYSFKSAVENKMHGQFNNKPDERHSNKNFPPNWKKYGCYNLSHQKEYLFPYLIFAYPPIQNSCTVQLLQDSQVLTFSVHTFYPQSWKPKDIYFKKNFFL